MVDIDPYHLLFGLTMISLANWSEENQAICEERLLVQIAVYFL